MISQACRFQSTLYATFAMRQALCQMQPGHNPRRFHCLNRGFDGRARSNQAGSWDKHLYCSRRKGPETICSARVIVVRIAATLVSVYWMHRGTIQYWPSSVGIVAQGRSPVDEHSTFALSKPIMPFGYSQELPECNRTALAVRAVRWDSHAGMAAAIVCYRPAVNLWTLSYEPHGGVASHPRQPHKRMR